MASITFWGLTASPYQLKMQSIADFAELDWRRLPAQGSALENLRFLARLRKARRSGAVERYPERDAELEKHNASRNPIMKAMHFRKAVDAFDQYDRLPLKGIDSIPSSSDVALLQDDLLLSKKGLIWMSHGAFNIESTYPPRSRRG